jgi:hypothetical protein
LKDAKRRKKGGRKDEGSKEGMKTEMHRNAKKLDYFWVNPFCCCLLCCLG